MTLHRLGPRFRPAATGVLLLQAAILIPPAPIAGLGRDTLPAALSDREFWSLTERRPKFCANVATLPLDAASTFIRPSSGRSGSFGAMAAETAGCPGK